MQLENGPEMVRHCSNEQLEGYQFVLICPKLRIQNTATDRALKYHPFESHEAAQVLGCGAAVRAQNYIPHPHCKLKHSLGAPSICIVVTGSSAPTAPGRNFDSVHIAVGEVRKVEINANCFDHLLVLGP